VTLLFYVLALIVMWVLAWGSLSVANVLGGLAVAAFLLWLAPDTWTRRDRLRLRPVAITRLSIFILVEFVKANAVLLRAIVARQPRVHTGVMAVPLPECSDGMLTVVSNVVALTPGTSPIHITRHPTVLYLHVLDMHDGEETRRVVQRLADLAYEAFGPDPIAVRAPDITDEGDAS
jgi:multicomponent Na+:H+ antiporter subunit E